MDGSVELGTEEGNDKASAIANGEGKKERPKRTTMDVAIYICGVVFAVGSLWIGYLGVAGHLKDQKLLGLWVFYGTLISVLTGAFLFFHQRISAEISARADVKESKEAGGPRPYVTVTSVVLQDLMIGQKPHVIIEYTVGGQVAAHQVQVTSRISLTTKSDYVPDERNLEVQKIDPFLAPSAKMFSHVFASWELTKDRLEQIKNGKLWLYAYGTIEYADETGHHFPSYKYRFRYSYQTKGFSFYSPPDVKPVKPIDFVVPDEGIPIDIDRPKIVVTKIALGDVAIGDQPRCEVILKNVSTKASAPKSSIILFIVGAEFPMSDTPPYPKLSTAPKVRDFIPKEEQGGDLVGNFTLTATDFEDIKNKKLWIYVYGYVDYTDGRNKLYKTKFCAWYNPDTGKIALCDRHNSAD
jgi:hypothetical protein